MDTMDTIREEDSAADNENGDALQKQAVAETLQTGGQEIGFLESINPIQLKAFQYDC
jgi:hypothetical protein